MKKIPIILITTFLIYSCEKSYLLVENDPSYPTTFEKINPALLNTMRLDYAYKNIYTLSSLDEYGFCGFSDAVYPPAKPLVDTTVSESEALAAAKEFISRNLMFTGIKDINDVSFEKVKKMRSHPDGNARWRLSSRNQRIDTFEVESTTIDILTIGREVLYCYGNWFPDIYVPKAFNLTGAEAVKLLINKKVKYVTWAGPQTLVISKESLNKSTTRLVVFPMTNNEVLEMWVAWKVFVPDAGFIFYVDVMTGRIIGEVPTFYSVM